ncbi:MAG: NfeD family protein [Blastocatellia bacterium]|nr:NfeD family protein [Blastocatellia bacterium]
MTNEWVIWLIVAAIFIAAEVFTPGFFLLWFGVGALVAALLALLGIGTFAAHMVIFLMVSAALVVASRTILERFFTRDDEAARLPSGIETMIGKIGLVVEPSRGPMNEAAVKVHGSVWTAYPSDGEWPLRDGDSVTVERIDGNAIYVRRAAHLARSFSETSELEK